LNRWLLLMPACSIQGSDLAGLATEVPETVLQRGKSPCSFRPHTQGCEGWTNVAARTGEGAGAERFAYVTGLKGAEAEEVEERDGIRNCASILDDLTMEQARVMAALSILGGPIALVPDAHLGMGA
jgi:hypothetical protein